MDWLGTVLEEYSDPRDITQEVLCLRTRLSALARQERIHKMRLKKPSSSIQINGTNTCLNALKKGICKQARLKRKIAIIHSRHGSQLNQSISSISKIVIFFTKTMKQADLQSQGGILQSNGIIINVHTTTYDLLLMCTVYML